MIKIRSSTNKINMNTRIFIDIIFSPKKKCGGETKKVTEGSSKFLHFSSLNLLILSRTLELWLLQ